MDFMSEPRRVVMQVVKRSGGTTHHVEFTVDENFAERLRQLRSLVPPLNTLNAQRDLVIDKVRVRVLVQSGVVMARAKAWSTARVS
jgi:hypothetical protein